MMYIQCVPRKNGACLATDAALSVKVSLSIKRLCECTHVACRTKMLDSSILSCFPFFTATLSGSVFFGGERNRSSGCSSDSG